MHYTPPVLLKQKPFTAENITIIKSFNNLITILSLYDASIIIIITFLGG